MNKNTRARLKIALRAYHVDKQGSTTFEQVRTAKGGLVKVSHTVHIGFVKPPPKPEHQQRQERAQAVLLAKPSPAGRPLVKTIRVAA